MIKVPIYRAVQYVGPETNWNLAWAVRVGLQGFEPMLSVDGSVTDVLTFSTLREVVEWGQRVNARLELPPLLSAGRGWTEY